ncbi:hypothetical protein ACIQTW_10335 [Paenarthrobacter sp. NPDC090517]
MKRVISVTEATSTSLMAGRSLDRLTRPRRFRLNTWTSFTNITPLENAI